VFGCDVLRDRREVRRRVGVVFHDSGLRADLTLDENVRFFCGLYGAGAEPRRADALLERLRLRERRRDQVRTFSRGMLQRAALVRSLLHDPALWLLDEPFTGLDPEGQSALESLIGEEVRHGRTVVVVTHQVDVGLRLADDAVLIEEGAIALAGREAIRRHHAASAAAGPVGGAR
jgi:ABC-type multidrug transport system ATPase subunit